MGDPFEFLNTGKQVHNDSNLVLAIDPGTTESGYVVMYEGQRVDESGVLANEAMLDRLRFYGAFTCPPLVAIEMVASYGMPVGREVFETVLWIGRFVQAWQPRETRLVYRRDVKSHLCASSKAKDANVRQALIDKFGGSLAIGNKKTPGPLHGVKSHAWAALAVAVTANEVRA